MSNRDRVDQRASIPASLSARDTTGTMLVRCARDAISGTTPPKTLWMSCDRMTSDFCFTSSPVPSRTVPKSHHTTSRSRGLSALIRLLG